jgi:hypothetical protein
MKITDKTLMVGFETEVKLGNNDAIEMTLHHQAFIFKNDENNILVELDISADITNVKFLGMPIEEGYKGYKQFKTQLLELGIDVEKLIDEKEKEMDLDKIETMLKLMFTNKFNI